MLAKIPDENTNHFMQISGLPISPYFSALKIRWLKDNIPAVRKACRERKCLAGTIDSWLVWVILLLRFFFDQILIIFFYIPEFDWR